MERTVFAITGFVVGAIIAAAVTAAMLSERPDSDYKVLEEKLARVSKSRDGLQVRLDEAYEELYAVKRYSEEMSANMEGRLENANRTINDLKAEIILLKEKPAPAVAGGTGPEKPAKEISEEEKKKKEEAEKLTERIRRFQRIAKIGEPLSKEAIKDLGLDENQIANVNDILKDEGRRMLERLREFAATLEEGKTVDDFKGMSGVEISAKIQQHFMDELMELRKLPAEDQEAMNSGKRHIVSFLSEDSNLFKINKIFYKERMSTYDDLTIQMDEETLAKFKEKYLNNGDFIFPGPAGYGTGRINPEDLEK